MIINLTYVHHFLYNKLKEHDNKVIKYRYRCTDLQCPIFYHLLYIQFLLHQAKLKWEESKTNFVNRYVPLFWKIVG